MLRITTHEHAGVVTLELEGKLAGPWVGVVRDCWEQSTARSPGQSMQVDLRAVTFVDAGGKALLAEMIQRHAQFIARDCQMKAIVADPCQRISSLRPMVPEPQVVGQKTNCCPF